MLYAVLAFALAAPTTADQAPQPNAPESKTEQVRDVAKAEEPKVDLYSDTPPPSTFDKQVKTPDMGQPGRSLTGQLIQTVLALLVVVGLIYFIFKVGLSKYLLARFGGSTQGGQLIRIDERVQLSPKQALHVVQFGEERLLLGSGDSGVQLLARQPSDHDAPMVTPPPDEPQEEVTS